MESIPEKTYPQVHTEIKIKTIEIQHRLRMDCCTLLNDSTNSTRMSVE